MRPLVLCYTVAVTSRLPLSRLRARGGRPGRSRRAISHAWRCSRPPAGRGWCHLHLLVKVGRPRRVARVDDQESGRRLGPCALRRQVNGGVRELQVLPPRLQLGAALAQHLGPDLDCCDLRQQPLGELRHLRLHALEEHVARRRPG